MSSGRRAHERGSRIRVSLNRLSLFLLLLHRPRLACPRRRVAQPRGPLQRSGLFRVQLRVLRDQLQPRQRQRLDLRVVHGVFLGFAHRGVEPGAQQPQQLLALAYHVSISGLGSRFGSSRLGLVTRVHVGAGWETLRVGPEPSRRRRVHEKRRELRLVARVPRRRRGGGDASKRHRPPPPPRVPVHHRPRDRVRGVGVVCVGVHPALAGLEIGEVFLGPRHGARRERLVRDGFCLLQRFFRRRVGDRLLLRREPRDPRDGRVHVNSIHVIIHVVGGERVGRLRRRVHRGGHAHRQRAQLPGHEVVERKQVHGAPRGAQAEVVLREPCDQELERGVRRRGDEPRVEQHVFLHRRHDRLRGPEGEGLHSQTRGDRGGDDTVHHGRGRRHAEQHAHR